MKSLLIICLLACCDGPIQAQRRIRNGTIARGGQFPYMAYLAYRNGKHLTCGASIIHKRWLLTAGHCFLREEDDPVVKIGTTKFDALGGGHTYKIEEGYVHEGFEVVPEQLNDGLEYVTDDIALLRTDRAIKFTDKVDRVRLARDCKEDYSGRQVVIAGWGKEKVKSHVLQDLNYITVSVLSQKECRKIWTYIDGKYLCTSNTIGGVCYSDSGNPVVLNGVQIGIVTTTDKYCRSRKPDLHVRVSHYIAWIIGIMKKHGDKL